MQVTSKGFNEWYKTIKPKIDQELTSFLAEIKRQRYGLHPSLLEVMEEIERFSLNGGKRLRPILTCLGYRCAYGPEDECMIRIACSWELVQTYLLIHDDIIDRSNLRRWAVTTHKLFEQRHIKIQHPKHFGASAAILAGDLAAQLALYPVLYANIPNDLKLAATRILIEVIESVCQGQIMDIFIPEDPLKASEDTILLLDQYKTARYTIEGPLQMGYILGGGGLREVRVALRICHSFGDCISTT